MIPIEKTNEFPHFPELRVFFNKEGWQEDAGKLLSMDILKQQSLSDLSGKTLYRADWQTVYYQCLKYVRNTRWTEMLDPDSSPNGSCRSLYKRPIERKVGDFQWRTAHGILATNSHLARLNSLDGEDYPFCGVSETVFHVFIECPRLNLILDLMKTWGLQFTRSFNGTLFIFGPIYCVKNKRKVVFSTFYMVLKS